MSPFRVLLAACLLSQSSFAFALSPPGRPVVAGAAAKPALLARTPTAARANVPLLSAASLSVDTSEPAGAAVLPSIINLAKNIVGSGVLALAAGVAAVSTNRAALGPALIVLVMLGAISGCAQAPSSHQPHSHPGPLACYRRLQRWPPQHTAPCSLARSTLLEPP